MPDEPKGWRDEWGTWHDYHAPDLGYMGPHPSGSLPVDAAKRAVAEAERIVAVNDTPPGPIAAPEAVAAPREHRDGWYEGGVWVDRPPKEPVDALRGFRLYLHQLREMIDRERGAP